MLIKSADDKSKRLALLEDLQNSPVLDAWQKNKLREELLRLRKGIQGEKDAAFYLNSYFKGGENHALLHDLRVVVDGDVAQIDHLIINRAGHLFLLETKNYAANVEVNAHGEFTAVYDEGRYGIPSPLEQSLRHERILFKLMETLGIVGRTDKKLDFHHVVMLHPKAIIQRPDPKVLDTSYLIKADQFPSWHTKFADKFGVGALLKAAVNMRSQETVKEWGEKLKRQHQAPDLLALPSYLQPKPHLAAVAQVPKPAAPAVSKATAEPAAPDATLAKKLICAHCREKISYPEGKFCWNNAKRFGGLQYCRDHQGLFVS
ncbi:MAG: NERD domain-containing protein [Betaproteobacteria bacterium]|nr:NERD domain-containing protein [Betaproteobacteria bacterium]